MKRFLKTAICTLLLISTVFCSTTLAADKGSLSVYIASDIHYRPASVLPPISEVNNLPDDEIYSHCNTKGMLTYEAGAIVDEFLKRFEKSDSDILLIPGDISEDGYWEEHYAIADKLREFKSRTGKRIFLIPGNHDIRTSKSKNRLDLADFMKIYADIGYDEALTIHENSASFTAELDSDYRLIGIDTCVYREDSATVSDELLAWIKIQIDSAKCDEKKLIAMVHHNVLEHFAIEGIAANLLCVEKHRSFSEFLADNGIKYVFTGHGHANDISTAVTAKGNRIYDIETGSLITYPNAYRCVTFSDSSVDVKTECIDKINTDALPDGYTDKQINIINNDFKAYSLSCMRAGMRSFTVTIPVLIDDISEKLKIEKGTAAYSVAESILYTLKTSLELPLYDNNTKEIDSISEIAAFADIALPESDYVDLVDIGASIYAGHYAGNESIKPGESRELTLLSNALNGIMVYALINLPLSATNALLYELGLFDLYFIPSNSIYEIGAKAAYLRTAGEKLAIGLLLPVAGGIINDISDPEDLNVTLEAYSQNADTFQNDVPLTFFAVIKKLISVFLQTIINTFNFIIGK